MWAVTYIGVVVFVGLTAYDAETEEYRRAAVPAIA